MKNLFLLLLTLTAQAVTLPLYIDTTTNTVVSPDAPTTLAGYGIEDAIGGDPADGNFLVGDGSAFIVESGNTAQVSLGIINDASGINIGQDSLAQFYSGVSIGIGSDATSGIAIGLNSEETAQGVAIGGFSSVESGVSVGISSSSLIGGVAIGNSAVADGDGRVQLGSGTNAIDSTIQFLSSGSVTAAQFGRLNTSTTSVTSTTYTANATDSTIIVHDDTAGAVVTITLPPAATVGDGFALVILKKDSTAHVVIDGNGSETINGSATQQLTGQHESIKIITNGIEWFIISGI